MRPAHSAREINDIPIGGKHEAPASMRPAHSAREIGARAYGSAAVGASFNEARAFSAGNLMRFLWEHWVDYVLQ